MISWLESTTAATSGSTRTTASDDRTDYTYSEQASTSADYSGTTHSASYSSTGYPLPLPTDTDATIPTSTFAGVLCGITVIGSVDSSSTATAGGAGIFLQGGALSRSTFSTVASTRERQTSTTEIYAANLATTKTTNHTKQSWATSQSTFTTQLISESTTQSATSSRIQFYSTTQAQTTMTTATTATTRTRDTVTTSGTEVHYGADNTIQQCRTSDADAEIAWTAPNTFDASSLAISAISSVGTTATRWTESANTAVLDVTLADTASGGDATQSFAAVSSAIPHTTSTTATTSRAVTSGGVFPISTASVSATKATTTASTISVTFVPATTLSTVQAGYSIPTEAATSWINSKTSWTTGNGQITWHQFSDVPATVAVTRLADRLLSSNCTVSAKVYNTTRQGMTTHSAAQVTQATAGFAGVELDNDKGAFANVNLGKTFTLGGNFTVLKSRSGGNVSTVYPTTYSLEGADFNGTMRISGKSVSATFVPTDTAESSTTTTAMFSANGSGSTANVGQRAGLVGGTPAASETVFASYPFGAFKNQTGGTVSKLPSVSSGTSLSATTWWEPIVGVLPGTALATGSIVSFTTTRNRTALPQ